MTRLLVAVSIIVAGVVFWSTSAASAASRPVYLPYVVNNRIAPPAPTATLVPSIVPTATSTPVPFVATKTPTPTATPGWTCGQTYTTNPFEMMPDGSAREYVPMAYGQVLVAALNVTGGYDDPNNQFGKLGYAVENSTSQYLWGPTITYADGAIQFQAPYSGSFYIYEHSMLQHYPSEMVDVTWHVCTYG